MAVGIIGPTIILILSALRKLKQLRQTAILLVGEYRQIHGPWGEMSSEGRNVTDVSSHVHGAKRMDESSHGAKCLVWGEMSMGRIPHGKKSPWGEMCINRQPCVIRARVCVCVCVCVCV